MRDKRQTSPEVGDFRLAQAGQNDAFGGGWVGLGFKTKLSCSEERSDPDCPP